MRKFMCFLMILVVCFTFAGCKKVTDLEVSSIGSLTTTASEKIINALVSENSVTAETSKTESAVSSNASSAPVEAKEEKPVVCTHDYRKELVGVSCNTSGYIKYTCVKCGQSYKGESVVAGHDFTKFLCDRCGKIDPNSDVFWGVNAFLSKYGQPNGKGNINCYPNEYASLRVSNYLDQNNFFIEYQDDAVGEIFTLWVKGNVSTVSFRKGSTYGEYEIKNSTLSSAEKIVFDDFSTNPESPEDQDVFATECAPKIDKYLRMAENQILIPKMGLKLSDFGFKKYN